MPIARSRRRRWPPDSVRIRSVELRRRARRARRPRRTSRRLRVAAAVDVDRLGDRELVLDARRSAGRCRCGRGTRARPYPDPARARSRRRCSGVRWPSRISTVGRLAGAVVAEQRVHLALADLERQVVDGGQVAVALASARGYWIAAMPARKLLPRRRDGQAGVVAQLLGGRHEVPEQRVAHLVVVGRRERRRRPRRRPRSCGGASGRARPGRSGTACGAAAAEGGRAPRSRWSARPSTGRGTASAGGGRRSGRARPGTAGRAPRRPRRRRRTRRRAARRTAIPPARSYSDGPARSPRPRYRRVDERRPDRPVLIDPGIAAYVADHTAPPDDVLVALREPDGRARRRGPDADQRRSGRPAHAVDPGRRRPPGDRGGNVHRLLVDLHRPRSAARRPAAVLRREREVHRDRPRGLGRGGRRRPHRAPHRTGPRDPAGAATRPSGRLRVHRRREVRVPRLLRGADRSVCAPAG